VATPEHLEALQDRVYLREGRVIKQEAKASENQIAKELKEKYKNRSETIQESIRMNEIALNHLEEYRSMIFGALAEL